MVFRQESRTMIQGHHAYTTFLKEPLFVHVAKHVRPDQEMIRRIKTAFEVLKALCFRTSAINARRKYKRGPNLWQEHHCKAKDAQRGCAKSNRECTSIWGPMAKRRDLQLQRVTAGPRVARCLGEILGPYCKNRNLPLPPHLQKN